MFDPTIVNQYGFHDSIIEDLYCYTDTYSHRNFLILNGAFNEWERTEHSGCRYYRFHFSDITQLSMDEKNYQESDMIEFRILPTASGYSVSISISIDFGDVALIEFLCTDIFYTFYCYKGMSYKNIYYTDTYQTILENMRKAYQTDNFIKTQQRDLGDGYIVTADTYTSQKECADSTEQHTLYIQKCRLMHHKETIFSYDCIYNILTAAVILHQNGQHYFLFKTDLYGLSVCNLTHTRDIYHYIPEGYPHNYQQICGESFIITDIHYDSVSNLIAYGGCYWAGTNDVMVGDFSNPMHFHPVLISMHDLIEPDYELYDDFDFDRWENNKLYLQIDRKLESTVTTAVLKEKIHHSFQLKYS